MKEETTSAKDLSIGFNNIAYGAFVLLSLYFFLNKDLSSATINLGIALVFDPFDQNVTWKKRPVYQRAWMIIHLIVLSVLAGFLFTGSSL
jgi:hypothetical protein